MNQRDADGGEGLAKLRETARRYLCSGTAAERLVGMKTYASGEYPEVGDIVTFRGHKPTRPATVLEVDDKDDPRFVKVRWGNSKNTQHYGIEELVLVTPAEALEVW